MKSDQLLPGPLSELPFSVQLKIWACVPESEMKPNGLITARGMIAMLEAIKKYGPPELAKAAAQAIPEVIKAVTDFQRRNGVGEDKQPRE